MMNKETIKRICIAAAICVLAIIVYRCSPLGDYMTLAYMQERSAEFKDFVEAHYLLSVLIYMAIFTLSIAMTMPSSIILTLLGGYLFGLIYGVLFATLSVTCGVGLSYLVFRLFLKKMLLAHYAERAQQFQHAMKVHGASYLLMLHFSAVFPYFIINAFAAISDVPLMTMLWTSALGFLPQAIVYAMAGKELGSIKHMSDIFSWQITGVFLLLIALACLPMILNRRK